MCQILTLQLLVAGVTSLILCPVLFPFPIQNGKRDWVWVRVSRGATVVHVDLTWTLPPAVLVWSLYYLGTHPDVQERLYQEVLQQVGREGAVRYQDVKEMG